MKTILLVFLLNFASISHVFAGGIYDVTQYGAVADGQSINTLAIQKAIDDCHQHGGGTVLIPAGKFLTGCIRLKSNVNLHLDNGSELIATPELTAYQKEQCTLVLIEQAENVSVTGNGMLNGNGKNFIVKEEAANRPYVLYVRNSHNVTIRDVRLYQSARWTLRLQDNVHVRVDGISIYSHANFNNDGIDIDSRDVVIANCMIDSGDDAICLKSDNPSIPCENIVVTNCILASNCNLIKMGTSSVSGFRNISISNCVLRAASESPLHHWNKIVKGITDTITGIAGIALEIVDGGKMDQVNISGISMMGIQTPIFIRLGNRKNEPGSLRNINISNITATARSWIPCIISAVPGTFIENVTLRDMTFTMPGKMTSADVSRSVPEKEKAYPENRMFGYSLPAYGLYVRHVRGISLSNLRFCLNQADTRPALWLEDAHQIIIRDLHTDALGGEPLVKKGEIKDLIIQ